MIEDDEIIDMYFLRNEEAIAATSGKYGNYCGTVARNILGSIEDSEECVNDTWLKTWNAIPPDRPFNLKAFLGRITRNLSIDRWRKKRKSLSETEICIDELEECIPDLSGNASESLEVREALNGFLKTLKERDRIVFIKRYWYVYGVNEIAKSMSMTETNVKTVLMRTRNKLKEYLEKEGINL